MDQDRSVLVIDYRTQPFIQYAGEVVQIGGLKFRKDIPEENLEIIQQNKSFLKELETSDTYKLLWGIYKDNRCFLIFPYLVQSSCKAMNVSACHWPQIILQISFTFFPNLQHLILSLNLIVSVEPLAFINAPKLELIAAVKNDIATIQALNKVHWPQLKIVNFSINPLISVSPDRIFLGPKFQSMTLAISSQNFYAIQDIHVFKKLQAYNRAKAILFERNRIPQSK